MSIIQGTGVQITKGKVAIIDYVLKGDDGDILDTSENGEFAYLHGADNIIPGLESALEGKQAGDELQVSIEPAEAYGAKDPDRVQTVPIDMFEKGAKVEPGMQFHAQSPEGHMIMITVTEVDGDEVTIDGNHIFAGMNLHFDVSVCDVRDATDDEMEHGHVHTEGECSH